MAQTPKTDLCKCGGTPGIEIKDEVLDRDFSLYVACTLAGLRLRDIVPDAMRIQSYYSLVEEFLEKTGYSDSMDPSRRAEWTERIVKKMFPPY
jgi:hypothetical protein